MTVSEYSLIKHQIMLCVCSSDRNNQTLNELKEYFKDGINSPRRSEQIKTIGQLLHVLEIRDLLSESNVQSLKYIAQFVNNQELLNKISRFERNLYSPENNGSTSQKGPLKPFANSNPYSNLSDRKIQRIHETIVKELGTYWCDLARNLKFTQGDIDEIDKNYISLKSKTERVLEIYESNKDTQKWLLDLCEALEKARRKDLAKKINKTLVMNI